MATRNTNLSRIALLLGLAGIVPVHSAQAALVGAIQTYPDINLSAGPWLVYDHNAVSSTVGTLTVYAGGASLTDFAGDPTSVNQLYQGGADGTKDAVLVININNSTGAFVSGSVNITYGNSTTAPRYQWIGTIDNFGWNAAGQFDALWTVASDTYQNGVPGYSDGYLTGGNGGFLINSGTASLGFAGDWIIGSGAATATATTLDKYDSGLGTSNGVGVNPGGYTRVTSSVTSDVFATPVPEPETYGMMLVGLALLAPLARQKMKSAN